MSLKVVLALMLLLSFTESQYIPASYTYSTADIISVNGSSATGHCSNVTTNSGTTTCAAPSSSVLFDRHTPTFTGLDGDMWASQLLTLQPTTGRAAEISFDFSNNLNFRLERLEVVMFNCPQRGTAVQNIRLFDTIEVVTITPTITSCDSLVRECIQISSFAKRLSLKFFPRPGSEWVYLAELRFWSNNATCLPNTVFTTQPTITTSTTVTTNTSSTNEMLTTTQSLTKTIKTDITKNITTTTTTTTTTLFYASSTLPSFTIVLVVVLTSLLLILVGIMVAVLILWRCYCAKHHKHNTTQNTTLEQSQHTSSSQAQAHTHPALTLCEETGQVQYATTHHASGEDSPSHQTYSHLQQQNCKVRDGVQTHEGGSTGQNEEEIGEYSTLLHGHKRPRELGRAELTRVDKKMKKERIEADKMDSLPSVEEKKLSVQPPEIHTPVDQLYSAQVALKMKEKKQKHFATTQTYSSESDTPVDLLYAQVDKKKKKMQKDEETTQLHTPEADTPVDQLYAQVDKEKNMKKQKKRIKTIDSDEMSMSLQASVDDEKKASPQLPEIHTPVDQLYAQVDTKKKKKKQKREVITQPHTLEFDTRMDQLYAQVDKKEQKDEAITQLHTSETGTSVDHLYAQVDKKKKKQKDEAVTQLHTSETGTSVDQLYAQVDKKKKKKKKEKEACEASPEELGAVCTILNQ